jgi:hypothetical protein
MSIHGSVTLQSARESRLRLLLLAADNVQLISRIMNYAVWQQNLIMFRAHERRSITNGPKRDGDREALNTHLNE